MGGTLEYRLHDDVCKIKGHYVCKIFEMAEKVRMISKILKMVFGKENNSEGLFNNLKSNFLIYLEIFFLRSCCAVEFCVVKLLFTEE